MSTKQKLIRASALLLLAVCIAVSGFFIGRRSGQKELIEERELLQSLNRASIINMSVEDGPVYVIGHKSPDTDTVCSAIAYARLLEQLGFDAEPVISGTPNNETKYALSEAKTEIPAVLDNAAGKNIFLVDHSEYLQSVPGMDEAHIVGILDHHGVGSVSTGHQIVYDARPIGSTATIVWLDYLNYGLEYDSNTAYLMLCAILSDTANLTGTTTTDADRKAVETLAEAAGVSDVDSLYRNLYKELLSYEGFTDLEILFSDYKEYEAYGVTFGIGIVNAIDEESAAALASRMKSALPEGFKSREVGLMYAGISIRENGEKTDYIVPCDDLSEQILVQAFPDYDEYNGTAYIFRNGGLGRKTKFVPGLTDFLATQPHD